MAYCLLHTSGPDQRNYVEKLEGRIRDGLAGDAAAETQVVPIYRGGLFNAGGLLSDMKTSRREKREAFGTCRVTWVEPVAWIGLTIRARTCCMTCNRAS